MNKAFVSLLVVGLTIQCSALAQTAKPASKPAAKPAGEAERAARDETLRRQEKQIAARKLIEVGRGLYYKAKYEEAIAKLEEAIQILPRAKATDVDYQTAIHALTDSYYRLADAAYRAGDNAKAKQLAEKALQYDPRNRSAESLVVKIKQAEAQAKERAARMVAEKEEVTPATAPEFIAKKEQIKKLFREGKILLNSGQYDEAEKRFQQVLLLDPYNADANVLLNEINTARYGISQEAADLARTRRLWEITQGWVPPISREVEIPKPVAEGQPIADQAVRQARLTEKLNKIIFPELSFRDALITDVVRFLSDESRRYDPDKVGVSIVLQPGVGEALAAPAPMPAPEGETGAAAPAPTAGGRGITLSLRNIPLIEALKYITGVAGLKYRVEASAVIILPKDAPEGELVTRSYPVSPGAIKTVVTMPTATTATRAGAIGEITTMGGGAAGATVATIDIKAFFEGAGVPFPPQSSIVYNERTSVIIMRNSAENHEIFERILTSLNVVPSQVEIEAKFVEITQNDANELGFKWSIGHHASGDFIFDTGETDSLLVPGSAPTIGDELTGGLRDITSVGVSGLAALLGGGAPASATLGTIHGILTDPQFRVVIQALSQKKGADVLSAPKITTISGSSAQIKIVHEFIYPTEYDTQTQAGSGGGSSGIGGAAVSVTPRNFKTREVGVLLNVTPTVGADGYTINLTLIPEVSEFVQYIPYYAFLAVGSGTSGFATVTLNQPLFATRTLTTSIVIWDGQTVVLGGLMKEDTSKIDDKVPFFGDIPVVGRLFRSKSNVRAKTNLLIFVTARLIDPAGNPIHKTKV
jgi:general secretion pathway protein D